MTYKQIEASREVRLWIGQIIVPAATLAATAILAVPENREAVVKGVTKLTNSIRKRFKKKEA
jgi:hypothetical protein